MNRKETYPSATTGAAPRRGQIIPYSRPQKPPAAPRTVLEVGRPDVVVRDRSSTRSTDWRSECDTDKGKDPSERRGGASSPHSSS
jgi:hypothetical protein